MASLARARAALLAVCLVGAPVGALATPDTVTIDPVDFDRWMYPFNTTAGFRPNASTFSAFGATDPFDDRDGQFLIAVDTDAAGIPTGGGFNYSIFSVTVRATHFTGQFDYDPSYDAWQTYLDPLDPEYVADVDAGRPIELYGVDFRNGYTAIEFGAGAPGTPGFEENESFGSGQEGVELRHVFPLDFDTPQIEDDVSNNLTLGFDPQRVGPSGGGPGPWAVGLSTSGLMPGDPVPEGGFVIPSSPPSVTPGETFEFTLDVSDHRIQTYVREGLDRGDLAFLITSLHGAQEQQGGFNPNFFTKDNTFTGAIPPSVEIVYLPEPGIPLLLASGLGGMLLLGRKRMRG